MPAGSDGIHYARRNVGERRGVVNGRADFLESEQLFGEY